MSKGAYAADKALYWTHRMRDLREGRPVYPVHLHLIPSDYCNLACPGCAYRLEGYSSNQLFRTQQDGNNPKRFLPWHVLEKVLNDCAAMGTVGVEVTGGGEPTMHPRIVDLLALAQDLSLSTALITNGLTLHRQDLLYRAAKCAWVRLSIDAATGMTYDRVRPSLGGAPSNNLTHVLDALTRLRRMRDEVSTPRDCVIGAGFVVQRENWTELYDAASLYRQRGADNVRISGLFTPQGDAYFEGWRERALALEQRAVAELNNAWFTVYGRLGEKLEDLHAPPDYRECLYQRFTLYLGADGNLYRCCVTSYNRLGLLGNVVEAGGLKALLDREEVQRSIREFDARSCPRCQFNDRNRAIARALQEPILDRARPLHAEFV